MTKHRELPDSKGLPSGLLRLVARALGTLAALLMLGGGSTAGAAPVEPKPILDIPAGVAAGGLENRAGLVDGGGSTWDKAGRPDDAHSAAEAAKPSLDLPAPAALWLFGSGLGALGLARRRVTGAWRRRTLRQRGDQSRAPGPAPHDPEFRAALRERLRCAVANKACAAAIKSGSKSSSGKPPGSSDGAGGSSGSPKSASLTGLMGRRFEELANALTEQPNVSLGRAFGRPCLKLGKRPFVVLDDHDLGIAFRVGEARAGRMCSEMSNIDHWNPKHERQPKLSWVVCRVANGEVLVHLAAAAYEQALHDSMRATAGDGSVAGLQAA